eukprot:1140732-Pelagomonas_calceolata.AAC.1
MPEVMHTAVMKQKKPSTDCYHSAILKCTRPFLLALAFLFLDLLCTTGYAALGGCPVLFLPLTSDACASGIAENPKPLPPHSPHTHAAEACSNCLMAIRSCHASDPLAMASAMAWVRSAVETWGSGGASVKTSTNTRFKREVGPAICDEVPAREPCVGCSATSVPTSWHT